MRHLISILLVVVVLAAAGFAMLGLPGRPSRQAPFELFSDMDRQPRLRPQKPFEFFANGVSSQMPVAGTIGRGAAIQTANGPVYPFEDSPVNTGCTSGTTNFVDVNPLSVEAELL